MKSNNNVKSPKPALHVDSETLKQNHISIQKASWSSFVNFSSPSDSSTDAYIAEKS